MQAFPTALMAGNPSSVWGHFIWGHSCGRNWWGQRCSARSPGCKAGTWVGTGGTRVGTEAQRAPGNRALSAPARAVRARGQQVAQTLWLARRAAPARPNAAARDHGPRTPAAARPGGHAPLAPAGVGGVRVGVQADRGSRAAQPSCCSGRRALCWPPADWLARASAALGRCQVGMELHRCGARQVRNWAVCAGHGWVCAGKGGAWWRLGRGGWGLVGTWPGGTAGGGGCGWAGARLTRGEVRLGKGGLDVAGPRNSM